jgi:hypothetical protein
MTPEEARRLRLELADERAARRAANATIKLLEAALATIRKTMSEGGS